MKEFAIANFKYGLDSRRDALTSLPGTLVTLQNGHVTPGGTIEKRKSFELSSLTSDLEDTVGDRGMFGLESVDEGLIMFGHALPFGSTVTQGQPTLTSAVGADLNYQQLQHPAIIAGETYDRTIHRITAVPFSKSHNGNAFVAATFADGNTFLYYDGEHVKPSSNGMVLTGRTTLAELSTDLDSQIEDLTEWVSIANTTEAGVAQNGTTTIRSPKGVYFTPVSSFESTAGQLGQQFIDKDSQETTVTITRSGSTATATTPAQHTFYVGQLVRISGATQTEYNGIFTITAVTSTTFDYTVSGTPATPATGTISATSEIPATSASASFQVGAATGTYELTAPANVDGTGTAALTGGTVAGVTSTTVTAAAIVQAVNDLTYVHGYTALKNATDSVFVYAPASWGASANGFNLTVNVAGGASTGAGGTPPTTLVGTISPSPCQAINVYSTPATRTILCQATASASGGTAPYTYAWAELSTGSGGGITVANTTTPTATFSKSLASNTYANGQFKCTITDSAGSPQSVVVVLSVSLGNEYDSGL